MDCVDIIIGLADEEIERELMEEFGSDHELAPYSMAYTDDASPEGLGINDLQGG